MYTHILHVFTHTENIPYAYTIHVCIHISHIYTYHMHIYMHTENIPHEYTTHVYTCTDTIITLDTDVWKLVWENGLYSVNYILNKHKLVSSQAGSIGGTARQEVEAGQ